MSTDRQIIHMDQDAFFVSVEVRKNPALTGKPVIIGSLSDRGVVTSCSYEARKFGLHAAMPARMARMLCPHGIWIKGNMDEYSKASHEITAILTENVPLLEKVDDQTKITSRLKANLSSGQNSCFNLGYNNRIFNRLDINYSGTLRYSRYHFDYAGSPVTVTQFTGQAYLDNQLELPNNWWLNVYTFASTRVTYGNNITLPMTTTSLSGGTKLLKNKATLSLSFNDVFFTGIQRSRTDYGNVHFANRSQ